MQEIKQEIVYKGRKYGLKKKKKTTNRTLESSKKDKKKETFIYFNPRERDTETRNVGSISIFIR